MKKLTLICAVTGLSMGFFACAEDEETTKAEIGAACEINEDCASGICGNDKKCASPDADGKLDNGEKCTKADECRSNYCSDDGKCADKPAAKGICSEKYMALGMTCAKDKYCDGSQNCVDKPLNRDACKDKSKGEKCGDKMICDDHKACVFDSSAYQYCQNKIRGEMCDVDRVCDDKGDCIPNNTYLCLNKKAGDVCKDGFTCQAEKAGGQLFCFEKDFSLGKKCGEGKMYSQKGVCAFDGSVEERCSERIPGNTCASEGDGSIEICNAESKCVSESVYLCEGKIAGDTCDLGKICNDKKECVDMADPCKDKKADDLCGHNKICDSTLKCVNI